VEEEEAAASTLRPQEEEILHDTPDLTEAIANASVKVTTHQHSCSVLLANLLSAKSAKR